MSNLLQPLRDQLERLQLQARSQLSAFPEECGISMLHDEVELAIETLEYTGAAARDLRTEALRAEMRRDGYDTWHHATRAKLVRDCEALAKTLDQVDSTYRLLRAREQSEIEELRRIA